MNLVKQVHNYANLGNYHVPSETSGGLCVDIGGNTGAFMLKYKDFFSEIHVYEPQPECFEIINNRLKETGNSNIQVFPEAVFHTSGETVSLLSHSSRDSGSVALHSDKIHMKEWDPSEVVSANVNTISLEDVKRRLDNRVIDYMKMDCETSEYNFLMDKDLSGIKYLGIEIHWQLGHDNWHRLMNYILKWFDLLGPHNIQHPHGYNMEYLFKAKV